MQGPRFFPRFHLLGLQCCSTGPVPLEGAWREGVWMFLEEVPQPRGGCLHTHFYPDLCAHLSDSNTYNKADWKPRAKKTQMNFGEPIISHAHSGACL